MDSEMAKEMIGLIRKEGERRLNRLRKLEALCDGQGFDSDEQWLFTDGPFINEMCLMVLVALRHQVERELVSLAARSEVGPAITREQYEENVTKQREQLRDRNGWAKLMARLNPKFSTEERSMKTLRLLANCFKHAPDQDPDETLLTHLGLLTPPGILIVGYLPLPESSAFREGLATSVGLPNSADYCMIADKFVDLANQFLEEVRKNTNPARVKVSFTEASA